MANPVPALLSSSFVILEESGEPQPRLDVGVRESTELPCVSDEVQAQIAPRGVSLTYQLKLLGTRPRLELLLAFNRVPDVPRFLDVDQFVDLGASSECARRRVAVLDEALREVARHTDVQRPGLIRENVEAIRAHW